MKVSFSLNFKDRVEEALIKTTQKVFQQSQKKKTIQFHDPSADLDQLNSSGFLELWKFKKRKPLIFNYYGHPHASYLPFFHSQIELFRYFRDKKADHRTDWERIRFFLLASASYFIPLAFKRKIFQKADLTIVPLRSVKNKLRIRNCQVIKIGIDPKKFKKLPKKKETPFRVGYIGHNAPLKGLKDAIDAFGLFSKNSKEKIEFSLHLSDPSQKNRRYAQKTNKNIKVYGRSEDIVKTYRDLDILVLPFRSENAGIVCPLVLLEAMACEKAIITTNLPNIKEIAGDSVLYVPPFSPKKLKKAIVYLFHHPQIRKQLGKKARKRILAYHQEKEMIQQYLQTYQSFENKPLK